MTRPDLTISPDPGRWSLDRHVTDQSIQFRAQLGLPSDAPIAMTGHQAAFWHPGILAKYFAADALCRRDDARPAWLVVDQDENNPLEIRCPVMRDDTLSVDTISLGDGRGPTGWRPPVRGITCPAVDFATPAIEQGMQAICGAMRAHEDADSLATQVARATSDLLAGLVHEAPIVHASQLARTDAFQALVARMLDDPEACTRTYNDAVAAHAGAGLRPLRLDDPVELPLWVIRDGVRMPAHADDVEEALPRALLMTGLMRLHGCNLFVHGTGGGASDGYEVAGEAWLRSWLGDVHLAPVTVASATVHLNLPGGPAPTDADVTEAKARARKARHDPSIIGDEQTARRKQDIVASIARAKKAGQDTSSSFQQMQTLLNEYRAEHADDLDRLDAEADVLQRRRGEASIREDRTWPFPLHDALDELKQAVDAQFQT